MTATATQQVIHNGSRNLVLKYTIGGLTGDATAEQLVNISSLDSTIRSGGLRLEKAIWSLTGFSCKLQWESGATNVDLIEMTTSPGSCDFSRFGGITNNATFQTGNVLFTTTGYTAAGDGGDFILWFKKKGDASDAALQTNPDVGAASLTLASEIVTVTVA